MSIFTHPFKKSAVYSAIASLFLLAGCGGDNQANETAAIADVAPDLSQATLANVQEITINNGSEPESLDPHKVSGVPESNILRQLLEGLTTTDADGNTIAGMAKDWQSADNMTWVFNLRDANWSNGDAVTAQDFVYSFRRVVNPETASPYASYLADIKVQNAQDIIDGKAAPDTLGVRAIDDKTLEIVLTEPVPYLPDTLIHTSTKPVHQKTVETFGDKWTNVGNFVGNGAYLLDSWQVNERITLVKNPAYYDSDATTIEKATILAIEQATTDVARYKAGEVDITAATLPPEQYSQLKAELGHEVKEAPSLCTYYYEFNHTKAPFNDARVRRALALTLDREIIVDSILKQGQKAAYQFTPEFTQGMKNNTPAWKSWSKQERIDEARKLLAEAGFDENNPLQFELLYNTSEQHKTLAVAAASFWKEALGVQISLNNQEWKTYLDTRRKQEHQVARGGWCADYNEPSSFLNTFKSTNSSNYGKYANPEFDKIMDQTLGASVDSAARAELYRKAEEILDADTATIFVYQYSAPRLVKSNIAGFSVTDPMDQWRIQNLKIVSL